MIETKEFNDIMRYFEKIHGRGLRLDKEDFKDWQRKLYYQNGEVNKMFIMFFSGYMLGRLEYMPQ